MAMQRFSGRKNLLIDLGLSLVIALTMCFLSNDAYESKLELIGDITGRIIGIFCLFFIWSWKYQHIANDKLVRICLHIICIFMLSIISFVTWLYLIYSNSFLSIFMLSWGVGIAVKYKRLFLPKNPQQVI